MKLDRVLVPLDGSPLAERALIGTCIHGRRGLRRMVLGSVAESVLRTTTTPFSSFRRTPEICRSPRRRQLSRTGRPVMFDLRLLAEAALTEWQDQEAEAASSRLVPYDARERHGR